MEIIEFVMKFNAMCNYFDGHCCNCPFSDLHLPCGILRTIFTETCWPKVIDTVDTWFINTYSKK